MSLFFFLPVSNATTSGHEYVIAHHWAQWPSFFFGWLHKGCHPSTLQHRTAYLPILNWVYCLEWTNRQNISDSGLTMWNVHSYSLCLYGISLRTPASSHQNVHDKLLKDFKLSIGWNVSVKVTRDSLQHKPQLEWGKSVGENGWIDWHWNFDLFKSDCQITYLMNVK